jgi:hypothetical protein
LYSTDALSNQNYGKSDSLLRATRNHRWTHAPHVIPAQDYRIS